MTKPWEILIWRGAPKPWEVSTYSNEKLRWTVSNRRFPHFQCQPQRERLSVFASRGGVESPRVRRSGRGGSTSRPRSGVRRPRAAPGARLARFAALTAGKRRRTPRTEREAGVQSAEGPISRVKSRRCLNSKVDTLALSSFKTHVDITPNLTSLATARRLDAKRSHPADLATAIEVTCGSRTCLDSNPTHCGIAHCSSPSMLRTSDARPNPAVAPGRGADLRRAEVQP